MIRGSGTSNQADFGDRNSKFTNWRCNSESNKALSLGRRDNSVGRKKDGTYLLSSHASMLGKERTHESCVTMVIQCKDTAHLSTPSVTLKRAALTCWETLVVDRPIMTEMRLRTLSPHLRTSTWGSMTPSRVEILACWPCRGCSLTFERGLERWRALEKVARITASR